MDTYLSFLVIGVILVVIDGQLILRSGRAYLMQGNYEPQAANSMARLVAVLFHLVVLGLLLLISPVVVPVDGSVQQVVSKLGLVLLLLGLAHAVTMMILNRIRARQSAQRIADEVSERYEERHQEELHGQQQGYQSQARVGPAAEGAIPHPMVSPAIEDHPGSIQR